MDKNVSAGALRPVAGYVLSDSQIFDAIADWCDALHGDISLSDAFGRLVAGLGASAGMLVRTHLADLHPVRVAIWDSNSSCSPAPLQRSYADDFFGRAISVARSASVWIESAHDAEGDTGQGPALSHWQSRRGLSEFAVLVLSATSQRRDHIELHFRHKLTDQTQAVLAAVLPTMARTWASRQIGLVTRSVVNHRPITAATMASAPRARILGTSNPARLSRAEFRVCMLLSRGLSAQAIASELAISETTVRSHLRSIYAKTGSSGMIELVYRLVGPAGAGIDDGGWTNRHCA